MSGRTVGLAATEVIGVAVVNPRGVARMRVPPAVAVALVSRKVPGHGSVLTVTLAGDDVSASLAGGGWRASLPIGDLLSPAVPDRGAAMALRVIAELKYRDMDGMPDQLEKVTADSFWEGLLDEASRLAEIGMVLQP